MLIDYVSDVHVSHHIPFKHNQEKWERVTKEWTKDLLKNNKGEVLIIAGDISEWNQQSAWLLEQAGELYERVYFVVGNHDYYLLSKNQKKRYGNSINKVEELFKIVAQLDNVIPLHKTIDVYKGVVFAGHSMWYNLKDERDVAWYKKYSNDKPYIFTTKPYLESYQELYEDALNWYEGIERQEIDVFVSHFPPINPPTSPYEHNACYVGEVPFLIGKHWVCGHQHLVTNFCKFDTHFHMNPIGYPNEKHKLEVQTFEVVQEK